MSIDELIEKLQTIRDQMSPWTLHKHLEVTVYTESKYKAHSIIDVQPNILLDCGCVVGAYLIIQNKEDHHES